jgi:hypothetical protein
MLGVGKRPSSTFIDPDGYIKTAHKCLIDELNEIYTPSPPPIDNNNKKIAIAFIVAIVCVQISIHAAA